MASGDRLPIGDVLPGATIHPLEDGVEFVEAITFVKTVDGDGEPAWSMRTTQQLDLHEVLGVLLVYTDILRRDLAEDWEF